MIIKILSVKETGRVSDKPEDPWIQFTIEVVDEHDKRFTVTQFARTGDMKIEEKHVVEGFTKEKAGFDPTFTAKLRLGSFGGSAIDYDVWTKEEILTKMKGGNNREQLIYWFAVGKIASMGMGNFMSDDMEKYKARWADFALFVDKFIQERLKL